MISTSILVLEPHLASLHRFKRWIDKGEYVEPIPLSGTPYNFTENEYLRVTSLKEKLRLRTSEIFKQFLITLGYIVSQLVGAIAGAAMLDAVLLRQGYRILSILTVERPRNLSCDYCY